MTMQDDLLVGVVERTVLSTRAVHDPSDSRWLRRLFARLLLGLLLDHMPQLGTVANKALWQISDRHDRVRDDTYNYDFHCDEEDNDKFHAVC